MDEDCYDIESLINTLDLHDKQYQDIRHQRISKGIDPGEEFSLPLAMKTMCQEIIEIKKDVLSLNRSIDTLDMKTQFIPY